MDNPTDGNRDDGTPGTADADGTDCFDGDSSLAETTIRGDVLRVLRPGTRWLSSGWAGGFSLADAAYNVSVPTGFSRTDLDAYIEERRGEANFPDPGPTLLTGLSLRHARGARNTPVTVIATAGLSNPAALPISPGIHADRDSRPGTDPATGSAPCSGEQREPNSDRDDSPPGTVNLVVLTERALDDAGLVTLLATVVEAKATTLLAHTGFPGTTSDAVVVGCDPDGVSESFAGSATPVGAAARACVRDAVSASIASRYPDGEFPRTIEEAEYGVETTRSTEPFRPGRGELRRN